MQWILREALWCISGHGGSSGVHSMAATVSRKLSIKAKYKLASSPMWGVVSIGCCRCFKWPRCTGPVHCSATWAGMCEVPSLVRRKTIDIMVVHNHEQSLRQKKWDILRGTARHYGAHIRVLQELWVARAFSLRTQASVT